MTWLCRTHYFIKLRNLNSEVITYRIQITTYFLIQIEQGFLLNPSNDEQSLSRLKVDSVFICRWNPIHFVRRLLQQVNVYTCAVAVLRYYNKICNKQTNATAYYMSHQLISTVFRDRWRHHRNIWYTVGAFRICSYSTPKRLVER